ncbi:MAG: cysteine-rich small domain-containing protein [Acutalibacteraceae bacterium]|nr:cysteine-rich small domain-containing protein [Acutalibacteraceae bacterium]
MKNSSKFFSNTDCEYYPCHNGVKNFNCLFCYCPLYPLENCLGNYTILEINGRSIKDCSNCTFPHRAENYDKIMDMLKDKYPLTVTAVKM